MKKITVTTRKEDFEKLEPLLKDAIHFRDEKDEVVKLVVYIPDESLDELINAVQELLDFRYKYTMVEVSTPDFIVSSALKRAEKKVKAEQKTPVEKLIDATKPYTKLDYGKILLTSVAGIIALTGLFMNNVAIIIGAMLLSPLLGPVYSFAINTAVGRVEYAIHSVLNLFILIFMVILFSYFTTLIISQFIPIALTSEILARMNPSYIYILMALLLGFASILALLKGISESIAGVAIAAALLPPAVVTGISSAIYPEKLLNSLTLTLENIVGLMIGSLAATLILDIGPRKYYERAVARKFIVRTFAFLLVLMVLLLALSLILG